MEGMVVRLADRLKMLRKAFNEHKDNAVVRCDNVE